MPNYFVELWENLLDRTTGPLILRLVFGPLQSILAARKFAKHDVRKIYPPYLYRFLATSRQRKRLKRHQRINILKLFMFSTSVDLIYQIAALDVFDVNLTLKPLEAALVAIGLTVIPYLLIRGSVYRLIAKRYEKTRRGSGNITQRQPPHIH